MRRGLLERRRGTWVDRPDVVVRVHRLTPFGSSATTVSLIPGPAHSRSRWRSRTIVCSRLGGGCNFVIDRGGNPSVPAGSSESPVPPTSSRVKGTGNDEQWRHEPKPYRDGAVHAADGEPPSRGRAASRTGRPCRHGSSPRSAGGGCPPSDRCPTAMGLQNLRQDAAIAEIGELELAALNARCRGPGRICSVRRW